MFITSIKIDQFLELQKQLKEVECKLYFYKKEIKLLLNDLASLEECDEVKRKLLIEKIEKLKATISWEGRCLTALHSSLSKVKITLDNYLNNSCERNLLEYERNLASFQKMLNSFQSSRK